MRAYLNKLLGIVMGLIIGLLAFPEEAYAANPCHEVKSHTVCLQRLPAGTWSCEDNHPTGCSQDS